MNSSLSLEEILSNLESQIGFHREREAFHAGQKAHHEEQRALHAAQLENLTGHFEALKAHTAEIAALTADAPSRRRAPVAGLDPDRRYSAAALIARVIESKQPGARFGPKALTQEVNQLCGAWLRRPLEERDVSPVLRRLHAARRIEQIRTGRPHQEAIYARGE
jgi:hypothetical protein